MTVVLHFSEDGRYALCERAGNAYIHPVEWAHDPAVPGTESAYVNPNGRWECSMEHLKHYWTAVYSRRFPVPAGPKFVKVGLVPNREWVVA